MHRITLNVVDIWLSRFAHFLAGEIVAQHRGGLRLNTFLLSTEAYWNVAPEIRPDRCQVNNVGPQSYTMG